MPEYSSNDVGLAVGLTFASGLATTIGAALPFCIDAKKNQIVLGISVAFAAGVMLYISFVEILYKSLNAFLALGHSDGDAHLLTSACFFGGIIFMAALNELVHRCLGSGHNPDGSAACPTTTALDCEAPEERAATQEIKLELPDETLGVQMGVLQLESASDLSHVCGPECEKNTIPRRLPSPKNGAHTASAECAVKKPAPVEEVDVSKNTNEPSEGTDGSSTRQLLRSGMFTALAVGLHNFPEGLATFLGTLADPRLGASIAVAIAIHNIPEGIAVAMPIYYASGSKWKAFLLAFGSGVAEPIGGLIGYGIMHQVLGEELYGVAFGIIAGMMIYIALKELLPTARKQDPTDRYVTWCAILGFLVMDISLVLFKI